MPDDDRLYFRQLLSGRDFATGDQMAEQMVNFVYAIGDRSTGEAVLVDPAYAVGDIVDIVEGDGMTVSGVLATHYHADHIGGSIMGFTIEGVATLLERCSCPVHVQQAETPWVTRTSGVSADDLVEHVGGDTIAVGSITIQCLHTPGHTPGSQCFLVDNRLISGDTLFLEGCGRTDLPGSDPRLMAESLRMLSKLDDDVVVYPGHWYSHPRFASMATLKDSNYVLDPRAWGL